MKDGKLRYFISNGRHCIEYLENLAHEAEDPVDRNYLINHALSVNALCVELAALNSLYKETSDLLRAERLKVRDYEHGFYEKYVSEKIEEVKQSLIDHISEFGAW